MDDQLPHGNCYRVAPRLIAGEYPAAARIARYLDAGVGAFVDLTEAGELAPYTAALAAEAAARGVDVTHQRLAIPDFRLPRSPAAMAAILDAVDAAMGAGRTVYLHCRGGVGRTGTVVGCWLVRHGQRGDEALATLARHWEGVEKRARSPHSPETRAQRAYVLAWREETPR